MIDLKEYKKRVSEVFDDQEPPCGHEARFEAKLDAMLEADRKSDVGKAAGKRRGRARIFSAFTTIAAAVAIAAIFINRHSEKVDWFAGVADDPVAVYLAYSEKACSLYGEILSKDVSGGMERTVACVAEETVPMIDILPEEMDEASKVTILKEYYGELLNGLDKINKIK